MVPLPILLHLDAFCRRRNLPLVLVSSHGLFGSIRLCPYKRSIVETNHVRDGIVSDFRLSSEALERFPTLIQYAFSPKYDVLNMSYDKTTHTIDGHVHMYTQMTDADILYEHAHVPSFVILIRALFQYKYQVTTLDEVVKTNYISPKLTPDCASGLVSVIKAMQWTLHEDNFTQAIQSHYL